MIYDDDRDNPLTERISVTDRRWPEQEATGSSNPGQPHPDVRVCGGQRRSGSQ